MAGALPTSFFDRDARTVARALLGKVIRRRLNGRWLCARIIETEAYLRHEKASHSSLGLTESRKPMFMAPGTIYMYYARGGDSLNISCRGAGNAVLIKSAFPYQDAADAGEIDPASLALMRAQHGPLKSGEPRPLSRLCSGQTLLCKSLGLRVREWSGRQFDPKSFYIADMGLAPGAYIRTRRMGIPPGRDEQLLLRYIDKDFIRFCTQNPTSRQGWQPGKDYKIERWRP